MIYVLFLPHAAADIAKFGLFSPAGVRQQDSEFRSGLRHTLGKHFCELNLPTIGREWFASYMTILGALTILDERDFRTLRSMQYFTLI